MGDGGKGGGGDTTTIVRFAPYIESHHQNFLNSLWANVTAIMTDSPYDEWEDVDFDDAFFGIGYVMTSFPSLYDMYGKFMAGLDVETLFEQILDQSINSAAINNLVSAHATELSDDIIENADPRFVTGMRDINSVISSSFVVGRGMMETARTKALSKYDAELRYRMLPIAAERWTRHLAWNSDVIRVYAEIMKLYFAGKMDITKLNYEMAAKDALWPFTVLDFMRAGLGALTGAQKTTTDVAGTSTTQSAIGGAMVGAAAGWQLSGGNPTGAIVGGILGLGAGLFG